MVQIFCKLCLRHVPAREWKSHIAQSPHLQELPCKIAVKGPFKEERIDEIYEYFGKFGGIRNQNITTDGGDTVIEYRFWDPRIYSDVIHREHGLLEDVEISWFKKTKGAQLQHVVPDEEMHKEKFIYRKLAIINSLEEVPTFPEQILTFLNNLKVTNTETKEKRKIIHDDLTSLLAPNFNRSKLHFFGSSITGLEIHDSDANIYIDNTDSQLATLKLIHESITGSDSFEKVHLTDSAVTCQHKKTKISCELYIRNELPVGNSELIKFYLTLDERLKPLMLLIKFWADCYDLRCKSGFSSYTIYILVIFYLQQEPYNLPSVADLQKDIPSDEIDGWNCAFGPVEFNLQKNVTIVELLAGFFEFYGKFDYLTQVISPFLGKSVDKIRFLKPYDLPESYGNYVDQDKTFIVNSGMCIQDPFEHSRNISASVPLSVVGKFTSQCRKSHLVVLEEKKSLYDLFLSESNIDELVVTKPDVCGNDWILMLKKVIMEILEKIFSCEVEEVESNNSFSFGCKGKYNIWETRVQVLKNLITQFSWNLDSTKSLDTDIAVTSHIIKNCPENATWKMEVSVKFETEPSRMVVSVENEKFSQFFHLVHFLYIKVIEFTCGKVDMPMEVKESTDAENSGSAEITNVKNENFSLMENGESPQKDCDTDQVEIEPVEEKMSVDINNSFEGNKITEQKNESHEKSVEDCKFSSNVDNKLVFVSAADTEEFLTKITSGLSSIENFDNEIDIFLNNIDKLKTDDTFQSLYDDVTSLLTLNKLYYCGNTSGLLFISFSQLKVFIFGENDSQEEILKLFETAVRDSHKFDSVVPTSGNQFILKCVHIQTKVKCTFMIANRTERYYKQLLQYYISLSEKIRHLLVLSEVLISVYIFLDFHVIHMLVIFYLQVTYKLPSVVKLQENATPEIIDNWNFGITHVQVENPVDNVTVIDLLKGFCTFYDKFDFISYVVSPYLGYAIKGTSFLKPFELPDSYQIYMNQDDLLTVERTICVQDPFKHSENCTFFLTAPRILKLHYIFEKLPGSVIHGKGLVDIFLAVAAPREFFESSFFITNNTDMNDEEWSDAVNSLIKTVCCLVFGGEMEYTKSDSGVRYELSGYQHVLKNRKSILKKFLTETKTKRKELENECAVTDYILTKFGTKVGMTRRMDFQVSLEAPGRLKIVARNNNNSQRWLFNVLQFLKVKLVKFIQEKCDPKTAANDEICEKYGEKTFKVDFGQLADGLKQLPKFDDDQFVEPENSGSTEITNVKNENFSLVENGESPQKDCDTDQVETKPVEKKMPVEIDNSSKGNKITEQKNESPEKSVEDCKFSLNVDNKLVFVCAADTEAVLTKITSGLSSIENFDKEIDIFLNNIDKLKTDDTFQSLYDDVTSLLTLNKLYYCGNISGLLFIKFSELKVFIFGENDSQEEILKLFETAVRDSHKFDSVVSISENQFILNCVHIQTKVNCTFMIANRTQRYYKQLLQYYISLSEKIRHLLVLSEVLISVYRLLDFRVIHMLVIFYLQVTYKLPSVVKLQENAIPEIIDNWNFGITHVDVENPLDNVTVIDLFKGFCTFYDKFDFISYVVSPYLGYAIKATSFLKPFELPDSYQIYMNQDDFLSVEGPVCVQDPFKHSENCTWFVSALCMVKLCYIFEKFSGSVIHDKGLVDIFLAVALPRQFYVSSFFITNNTDMNDEEWSVSVNNFIETVCCQVLAGKVQCTKSDSGVRYEISSNEHVLNNRKEILKKILTEERTERKELENECAVTNYINTNFDTETGIRRRVDLQVSSETPGRMKIVVQRKRTLLWHFYVLQFLKVKMVKFLQEKCDPKTADSDEIFEKYFEKTFKVDFGQLGDDLKEYPKFDDQFAFFLKTVVNKTVENQLVKEDLNSVLASTFSGHMAYFYGSHETGLILPTSVLKIFVANVRQGMSEETTLKLIKNLLMECKQFQFVKQISINEKRVIKFLHVATKIPCELNIRDKTEVKTSQLINYYMSFDEKIKNFIIFIKFWAKCNNLEFSNHALYMLVIFYLQQDPYKLPSVVDLQKNHPPDIEEGWNCAFTEVTYSNSLLKNTTYFELIQGFFKFYEQFDFFTNVVSPYLGCAVDKTYFLKPFILPDCYETYMSQNELLDVDAPICIQDPFIHSKNLSPRDLIKGFKFATLSRTSSQLCSLPEDGVLHNLISRALDISVVDPYTFYIHENNNDEDRDWMISVREVIKKVLYNICDCVISKTRTKYNTLNAVILTKHAIFQNRASAWKKIQQEMGVGGGEMEKEIAVTSYITQSGSPLSTSSQAKLKIHFLNPPCVRVTFFTTYHSEMSIFCQFLQLKLKQFLEENFLFCSIGQTQENTTTATVPYSFDGATFDEQMKVLCDTFVDKTDTEKNYAKISVDLYEVLTDLCPDLKLELFGSRKLRLSFKDSNYDIFLDCKQTTVDGKFIEKILVKLVESKKFDQVSTDDLLIRCRHVNTNLVCILTISNKIWLRTSDLIDYFMSIDEKVRMLMVFVKFFANHFQLNGFNSCSLYLMVIFYLQKEPMSLPSVEMLQEGAESSEFWNTNFHLIKLMNGLGNITISQLVVGFLIFYANFDYSTSVVSIFCGQTVKKTNFLKPYKLGQNFSKYMASDKQMTISSGFCVQDPFDHSINITASISLETSGKLPALCRGALEILERDLTLSSSFFFRSEKYCSSFQIVKDSCLDSATWKKSVEDNFSVVLKTVLGCEFRDVCTENFMRSSYITRYFCRHPVELWSDRITTWKNLTSEELEEDEDVAVTSVIKKRSKENVQLKAKLVFNHKVDTVEIVVVHAEEKMHVLHIIYGKLLKFMEGVTTGGAIGSEISSSEINKTSSCFDAQITDFLVDLSQKRKSRQLYCSSIGMIISSVIPHIRSCFYGSNVAGLDLHDSDVNIYMVVNPELQPLEKVRDTLGQTLNFNHFSLMNNGIKFVHNMSNLWCVLTFNKEILLRRSDLINYYISLDPKVRWLILIIKYWVRQQLGQDSRLFSGYSLALMVIFYLQEEHKLPSVFALQKNVPPQVQIEGWNCAFSTSKLDDCPLGSIKLLDLMKGFFKFYGMFDYFSFLIAPFYGTPIAKSRFLPTITLPDAYKTYMTKNEQLDVDSGLCVQDPFEHSKNLSSDVTYSVVSKFGGLCRQAHEVLEEDGEDLLKKLFTPYIPICRFSMVKSYRTSDRNWSHNINSVIETIFTKVFVGTLGPMRFMPKPDVDRKLTFEGNHVVWDGRIQVLKQTLKRLRRNTCPVEKEAAVTEDILKNNPKQCSWKLFVTLTYKDDPFRVIVDFKGDESLKDYFCHFAYTKMLKVREHEAMLWSAFIKRKNNGTSSVPPSKQLKLTPSVTASSSVPSGSDLAPKQSKPAPSVEISSNEQTIVAGVSAPGPSSSMEALPQSDQANISVSDNCTEESVGKEDAHSAKEKTPLISAMQVASAASVEKKSISATTNTVSEAKQAIATSKMLALRNDKIIKLTALQYTTNMLSFSNQVLYYCKNFLMDKTKMTSRQTVVKNDLSAVLSAKFRFSEIYFFGSSVMELFSHDSNFDIYVEKLEQLFPICKTNLEMLKECLSESDKFNQVSLCYLTHAVKCVHKYSQIECKLHIHNRLPVCNSQLVAYYVNLDPKIHSMFIILKSWVEFNHLKGIFSNSNYILYLMIIFYLQQEPYKLFTVAELQKEAPADMIDGWNGGFLSLPFDDQLLKDVSVKDLLIGFFQYYGKFDYFSNVISPFSGLIIDKTYFLPPYQLPEYFQNYVSNSKTMFIDFGLCVQDVFEHGRNTASTVNLVDMGKLAALCRGALKLILTGERYLLHILLTQCQNNAVVDIRGFEIEKPLNIPYVQFMERLTRDVCTILTNVFCVSLQPIEEKWTNKVGVGSIGLVLIKCRGSKSIWKNRPEIQKMISSQIKHDTTRLRKDILVSAHINSDAQMYDMTVELMFMPSNVQLTTYVKQNYVNNLHFTHYFYTRLLDVAPKGPKMLLTGQFSTSGPASSVIISSPQAKTSVSGICVQSVVKINGKEVANAAKGGTPLISNKQIASAGLQTTLESNNVRKQDVCEKALTSSNSGPSKEVASVVKKSSSATTEIVSEAKQTVATSPSSNSINDTQVASTTKSLESKQTVATSSSSNSANDTQVASATKSLESKQTVATSSSSSNSTNDTQVASATKSLESKQTVATSSSSNSINDTQVASATKSPESDNGRKEDVCEEALTPSNSGPAEEVASVEQKSNSATIDTVSEANQTVAASSSSNSGKDTQVVSATKSLESDNVRKEDAAVAASKQLKLTTSSVTTPSKEEIIVARNSDLAPKQSKPASSVETSSCNEQLKVTGAAGPNFVQTKLVPSVETSSHEQTNVVDVSAPGPSSSIEALSQSNQENIVKIDGKEDANSAISQPYKILVKGISKRKLPKLNKHFSSFGRFSIKMLGEEYRRAAEYCFMSVESYCKVIQNEHFVVGEKITVIPQAPLKRAIPNAEFKDWRLAAIHSGAGGTFNEQVDALQKQLFLPTIKNQTVIKSDLLTALQVKHPSCQIYSDSKQKLSDSLSFFMDKTKDENEMSIENLKDIISRSENFSDVVTFPNRILRCKHSKSQIVSYLRIEDKLSWSSNQLLSYYLKLDSKLPKFLTVLKFWAECYNLISENSFSSNCIDMMGIFYLQQEPYKLPSVKNLQKSATDVIIKGWNCAFSESEFSNAALENSSVFDLVKGFFKFYSNFDYITYVISPYFGSALEKIRFLKPYSLPSSFKNYLSQTEDLPVSSGLCIQDFFEHSKNVTFSVTLDTVGTFTNLCHSALKIMESKEDCLLYKLMVNSQLQLFELPRFTVENQNPEDKNWMNSVKDHTRRILSDFLKFQLSELPSFGQDRVSFGGVGQYDMWENRVNAWKKLTVGKGIEKEVAISERVIEEYPKKFFGNVFLELNFMKDSNRVEVSFSRKTACFHVFHVCHFLYTRLVRLLSEEEQEEPTFDEEIVTWPSAVVPVPSEMDEKTDNKVSESPPEIIEIPPCTIDLTSDDDDCRIVGLELNPKEETPPPSRKRKHSKPKEDGELSEDDEEDDVPSDFFDDFSNEDFLDGFDIVDSCTENAKTFECEDRNEGVNKESPRRSNKKRSNSPLSPRDKSRRRSTSIDRKRRSRSPTYHFKRRRKPSNYQSRKRKSSSNSRSKSPSPRREAKKRKSFLEEIRDKLNEMRPTPPPAPIIYNLPSYTSTIPGPNHMNVPPPAAPLGQFYTQPTYDASFFIGNYVPFSQPVPVPPPPLPSSSTGPWSVPPPPISTPGSWPVPVPPPGTSNELSTVPVSSSQPNYTKEVHTEEKLLKLLGEKKISLSDYLTMTAKQGVTTKSSNPEELQRKVRVISQCQDVLKLLCATKPGKLVVNRKQRQKPKPEQKYCSPLKKPSIVRFQFTSFPKSPIRDVYTECINGILRKVNISENVNPGNEDIVDAVSKALLKSKRLDKETVSFILRQTLGGSLNRIKKLKNVATQCMPSNEVKSVGLQVKEEDLKRAKNKSVQDRRN